MEVLGGLVKLDNHGKKKDSLPLPWWHRAPIGLLHNTFVFIALVQSSVPDEKNKQSVGDLIVTVLDPFKWRHMQKIDYSGDEGPGLISDVIKSVLPENIAIAETVTIAAREKHHITLIIEPVEYEVPKENIDRSEVPKENIDRINKKFNDLKLTPSPIISDFFDTEPPDILWWDYVRIEHGWIHNVKWREAIVSKFPNIPDDIDLENVVVSADTEKRLIRYVFPKIGAFSIDIEHVDRPGALTELTDKIAKSNANILSAILRRGGAKPKRAIFSAICEPIHNSEKTAEEFRMGVRNNLKKLDISFGADFKIRDGEDMKYMIYPKNPDEVGVKLPNRLKLNVRKFEKEIPDDHIPVFISRRFTNSEKMIKIVRDINSALSEICYNSKRFYPIEATPDFGDGQLEVSIDLIMPKMWVAKAGIVVITKGEKEFSPNLAHEAGYLQGQGKPVLILVESESTEDDGMKAWSNIHGVIGPRFTVEGNLTDPVDKSGRKDSIYFIVCNWLQTIIKNGLVS